MAVPYLIGAPGGGKTAIIRKIFSERGYNILEVHFAFIPIEELSGIPRFSEVVINGNKVAGTEWTFPEIILKAHELSKGNKKVLIFMDDFHLCSPTHMSYGYQLFTDKRIRNYSLPNKSAIILAGNATSKEGAKMIHSAISNRLAFYNVISDYTYWKKNYAIPNEVNPSIITFLDKETNRSRFHEEPKVNEPWASPRSWDRLSRILNIMEQKTGNGLNIDDVYYLASSHIGKDAGSEFSSYYSIYKKLNISDVFEGKASIDVSNVNRYIYGMAATNEYVNRAIKSKNAKNITNIYVKITSEIYSYEKEVAVAMLKHLVDLSESLNNKKAKDLFIEVRSAMPDDINKAISKMISYI
ncbi:MAG: ATP-binding protein [Candidatus Anstonellales archaeon]